MRDSYRSSCRIVVFLRNFQFISVDLSICCCCYYCCHLQRNKMNQNIKKYWSKKTNNYCWFMTKESAIISQSRADMWYLCVHILSLTLGHELNKKHKTSLLLCLFLLSSIMRANMACVQFLWLLIMIGCYIKLPGRGLWLSFYLLLALFMAFMNHALCTRCPNLLNITFDLCAG